MNDDELGRILHDELHRADPPVAAPEAVHDHLRELRSMQPVRRAVVRPTRLFRELASLAAVFAICALIAAGLLMRGSQPETGPQLPANGIEAFARIDSTTAWAESGSDLYITRDAGATWSKGTVPGGLSPAQFLRSMTTSTVAAPTGAPAGWTEATEPAAADTPASPRQLLGHYYPDFVDADHGWLLSWSPSAAMANEADYRMTAWRTTDGGKTWASSGLPGTYGGVGLIQFVDASHGWITILQRSGYQASASEGGTTFSMPSDATTVLATADGGVTWSKVSTLAAIASPHFVSPTEAWGYAATDLTASAYSVIHSTDGGRTWAEASLPLPGDGDVIGWADPPSESNGSVVVRLAYMMPAGIDFLTFVSNDDGSTWSVQTRNSDHSSPDVIINSMASILDLPAGQPLAMISGIDPAAFRATFDGGATWTTYSTAGLPAPVSLAEWSSPDDVWIMTGSSGAGLAGPYQMGGQLYATTDGGKTWEPLLGAPAWPDSPEPTATPEAVPAPTSTPVTATTIQEVGRFDEQTGWVLIQDPSGADLLRLTEDGGATWSDALKAPPGPRTQFLDADHSWTMSFESTDKSVSITFHRTDDGGMTWQDSSLTIDSGPPSEESYLSLSFHFRDQAHGELFATFGPATATGGPAPSSRDEWTCSRYSTSDGGATWSGPTASPCLGEVTFQDNGFGYASDALWAPILYITTDGGQTWTGGSLPEGSAVNSSSPVALVQRRSDGTLRALGALAPDTSAPMAITSDDGGLTWTSVAVTRGLPSNTVLLQAVALSENRWLALIVGGGGSRLLYSSDDGGLTWQPLATTGLVAEPAEIDFVGPSDGWVVVSGNACEASAGSPQPCRVISSALFATTDGGATWKELLEP